MVPLYWRTSASPRRTDRLPFGLTGGMNRHAREERSAARICLSGRVRTTPSPVWLTDTRCSWSECGETIRWNRLSVTVARIAALGAATAHCQHKEMTSAERLRNGREKHRLLNRLGDIAVHSSRQATRVIAWPWHGRSTLRSATDWRRDRSRAPIAAVASNPTISGTCTSMKTRSKDSHITTCRSPSRVRYSPVAQ
jgi:hypothetical protein